MKIAIPINISLENRTGVEEYTYHLLRNLPTIDEFKNHQFFILTRKITPVLKNISQGYILKETSWFFKKFWTLFRLGQMLKVEKYDILFIPVYTFPLFCPKSIKMIVTVQGLEFEKLSKMYSYCKRKFLRIVTKRNIKRADRIIVPSQSTKNDLIKYYSTNPDKIFIVYHGVSDLPAEILASLAGGLAKTEPGQNNSYILYLGRGDKRKNIDGLIKAFKFLKQKYQIPQKLILTGPNIGYKIPFNLKNEVICTGFVKENEKWNLLKNADVFVFPSFYEGFGIPILEAQKVGTPVVCSSISSMPEVIWNPTSNKPSAVLVNPYRFKDIAEGIYKIIKNRSFADELIKRGYENVQRFNWQKSAKETLNIILK